MLARDCAVVGLILAASAWIAASATALAQATPPPPRAERPIIYGLQWATNVEGRPIVANVVKNSPAAKAGFQRGDAILAVQQHEVDTSRQVTEELAGRSVGERVEIRVLRQGRPQTLELIADGTLPVLADGPDAVSLDERVFGWTVRDRPQAPLVIAEVADGGAASRAGVRAGDVILAVDGREIRSGRELTELLSKSMTARQGHPVSLALLRGEREVAIRLMMPQNKAPAPAPRVAPATKPSDGDDSGRAFGMVVRATDGGLVVVDVAEGSPAAKAGLVPGDTLLTVGASEVNTYRDLVRALDILKPAAEVDLALAREGERMETTLVIGPSQQASRDAANLEALREQASHIFVGGVKAIYSFEQTTPDWQVTHRVAEIAVANVEKGDGIVPGQLVYVRYTVNTPTDEAATTAYPNIRSTFRLFVQRAADGGYDLLLPGGAQVIAKEPAEAAATPPAPTNQPAPTPPPAAPPVPGTQPRPAPVPAAASSAPGIDGVVLLGDAPQPGMQVDLWDAAGLVETTTTAANGTFSLDAPPGRYQISARGLIGTLIRVAPPITVFVPVDAPRRTVVRVPLP